MDKNLETGILIGAGLGLALAPVIKKIAKSLPGAVHGLPDDGDVKHLPMDSDEHHMSPAGRVIDGMESRRMEHDSHTINPERHHDDHRPMTTTPGHPPPKQHHIPDGERREHFAPPPRPQHPQS